MLRLELETRDMSDRGSALRERIKRDKKILEMVGSDADSSDFNGMAREVSRGCGGLPIATVTVGESLRNRCKDEWNDAARQLKNPVPKQIKGMDAFVYSRFELSYNYLETEAKSLFLICSMFPEDALIEVEILEQYGMALRLFQDVYTIENARVRSRALVSTLISNFLLLKEEKDGFVKMHDVVRDFAIAIASKGENKYMVRAGFEEYAQGPRHDGFNELKVLKLISYNDMKYLLDMFNWDPTVVVRNLDELQLVNLRTFSEICRDQLPSESLSKLQKLRVNGCNYVLNIVPSNLLGMLQCLQSVIAYFSSSVLNVFDLKGLATERDGPALLSRLEVLELVYLPKVMYIWKGSLYFVTFVNLCNMRVVIVIYCNVGQIFLSSMVQWLVHLEKLWFDSCRNLEEIVGMHNKEQIEIVAPGKSLNTSMSLQNVTDVQVVACGRSHS
ncbi:disease resistance protein RPS5-like [Actinidia eriantha]|uniref:disease resistance protein RPS5-like n=1 Tax=Actinidia eriantha TaxID=165200 RepID=UPI00258E777B|nr:disease resistance protein RPS5-like [Actinidia eriantha]